MNATSDLKECPACGVANRKDEHLCECGFDFLRRSILVIALFIWPCYLNDFYLMLTSEKHLELLWKLDFTFAICVPLLTYWLALRKGIIRKSWSLRPYPGRILLGLVFCGLLLVVDYYWLSPILCDIFPFSYQYVYTFPKEPGVRWALVTYASLTTGFVEELVYRGVVTSELQNIIGNKVVVVVLSCSLFAGAHWCQGPAALGITFFWAIPVTLWVVKTGDLVCPEVCHGLYDFLLFGELAHA